MKTKIEAVIFDFFGVISSLVEPRWAKKYLSEIDIIATMNEEYARVNGGEITEAEFFKRIAKLVSMTPENVRSEWMALASINSDLVAFIKNLRKHYKIALCSNSSSPFLREILERNGLLPLFDVIIISSEVRAMKPDPVIFRLVLTRLGIESKDAIFTDDNTQNVAGAESIGITSFVFSNLKQLKNNLESTEDKENPA
jgi:HAD superfamily hydrolase (TIGR01509 family)